MADKETKRSYALQICENFPSMEKELVVSAKVHIGTFTIPLQQVPQLIKDLTVIKLKNNL